jgi:hypothetical protein
MWRGGLGASLSVPGSFVCRCLTSWNMLRFHISSRPGEFRPQPLTDPSLTVSGHTAGATRGRLAPSTETIGFLLLPVDPFRSRLGDPLPSLHENYPVSSLLRSSPRLLGTSVLSASRGFRLGLLP